MVYNRTMQNIQSPLRNIAVIALLGVFVAGCAVEGGRKLEKVGRHEVAEFAGCGPDEVAMCVDTNCEPEEFKCVERGNAAQVLGVPEFPRY